MASNSDNTENGSTAPTTPKAAAVGGGGYSTLTTREQEILAKAMTCLKTAPEIDFPKLAAELNMSNPRSAVNAWSQIKKKMEWTLKASTSPTTGKTPTGGKAQAGSKRKKAAATVDDDNDNDDEETGAPAKRAKVALKPRKKAPATPKKGKAPVAAKNESDEDKIDAEDKVSSEDKTETVANDVKGEEVDGEI